MKNGLMLFGLLVFGFFALYGSDGIPDGVDGRDSGFLKLTKSLTHESFKDCGLTFWYKGHQQLLWKMTFAKEALGSESCIKSFVGDILWTMFYLGVDEAEKTPYKAFNCLPFQCLRDYLKDIPADYVVYCCTCDGLTAIRKVFNRAPKNLGVYPIDFVCYGTNLRATFVDIASNNVDREKCSILWDGIPRDNDIPWCIRPLNSTLFENLLPQSLVLQVPSAGVEFVSEAMCTLP